MNCSIYNPNDERNATQRSSIKALQLVTKKIKPLLKSNGFIENKIPN